MSIPRHSRKKTRAAGRLCLTAPAILLAALSVLPAGQKKRPGPAKPEPSAGPAWLPAPFRAGEQLEYQIIWSQFKVHAGTARVSVMERRPFYGREAWHFQALAHTTDTMRILYSLDDQFDSYTDPATLTSVQYEFYLHEQGRNRKGTYRMTTEGDPAPSASSAVRVLPGTRDPLGLVYSLRATDWPRSGEIRVPVFDGGTLYEVRARLELDRGQVSVPAGQFSASRIGIRVYERGNELADTRFWVWLAQNVSRTPVLLEAELPIGSARLELVRAE